MHTPLWPSSTVPSVMLGRRETRGTQPHAIALITSGVRPTVSPAKNSLVYFVSIAYIDHPVWKSHREEAKRGPLFGHRIPRNEEALMALLLPYVCDHRGVPHRWVVLDRCNPSGSAAAAYNRISYTERHSRFKSLAYFPSQ